MRIDIFIIHLDLIRQAVPRGRIAESIIANDLHAMRHDDLFQLGKSEKGAPWDNRDPVEEDHLLEFRRDSLIFLRINLTEFVVVIVRSENIPQACVLLTIPGASDETDRYLGDLGTIRKRAYPNIEILVSHVKRRKQIALERVFSDIQNVIGDNEVTLYARIGKGVIIYTPELRVFGYGDPSELTTPIKSIVRNLFHAVGQQNVLQIAAVIEGTLIHDL